METGNIAFILICSGLVFLMTPALAFFYGGLERRKNILNTMMMVICTLGLASILWIAIGYSLSFSGDHLLVGNLDKVFFNHVSMTKGDGIPEGLFATFQMMFALIATAIITSLLPKVKVSFVLEDKDVESVVDRILMICGTGEVGDGKIFISPIEEVIRIRTGQRGKEAI